MSFMLSVAIKSNMLSVAIKPIMHSVVMLKVIMLSITVLSAGNTKGGSITAPLTSGLTGLD